MCSGRRLLFTALFLACLVPGSFAVGWTQTCDDLSGIDFGPCEAILGWGVIDGECRLIGGCPPSPVPLFDSLEACLAACGPGEPTCDDLSGINFGACALVLGYGVIDGECRAISGCSSPVPLFETLQECLAACEPRPTCDDLSGIDFGPCLAILGYGVLNGVCQAISGCSSPVPLFSSLEECLAACGPGEPTCDDLSGIDFGPCLAILGYGVIDGVCQAISGCSSPVPLFSSLEECLAACGPGEPTCDDLSGIDFGPCDAILGYGVLNGVCQAISGCSSPVPLFDTLQECLAACEPRPTCDDLAGIDFGPCDAILGYGVLNGVCQAISGCSSPVPLFSSLEECLAACGPGEPTCDDLSGIDFGPCLAILGYGVIDGVCQAISGCSSPVPLFETLEECEAACGPQPTCDDLSGIDFGDCLAVLGAGVIGGECQLISGCFSPVPLFISVAECEEACPPRPTCDDLAGIDFGPCDAFLGYGVINGECVGISGCSSPVPLFSTLEECVAACEPVATEESSWGAVKARFKDQ